MAARWIHIVVFALLSATTASALDQTTAAVRFSTLSGVVTDTHGGPIKLAVVTLAGHDVGLLRMTSTDASGFFTFKDVPAGRFTVTAAKQGYLRNSFGSRKPGRAGALIAIPPGDRLEKMNIQLPRAGVVSGTVFDARRESVAGVEVRALRFVMDNGGSRLVQVGADRTDDRGAYRIPQLLPGEYLLSAVTVVNDSDTPDLTNRREYAPIYFPGTPSAEDALTVQLALSEERSGADIVFAEVRTLDVAGRISVPVGEEPCDPTVALVPLSPGLPAIVGVDVNTTTAEEGRFEFDGVGPGRYRLEARCRVNRGHALWASRVVVINEDRSPNAAELDLTLRPGMRVEGQVEFADSPGIRPDSESIRVALIPSGEEFAELGRSPFIAAVAAGGRFTISGVPPGRYDVTATAATEPARVTGVPVRWRMASAMVNGRDALDFQLEVLPDEDVVGLQVRFTTRQQSIGGTVADESGAPVNDGMVIAFPTDNRYWQPGSRRIVAVAPRPDGSYSIGGLPPGDYWIAAVPDAEEGEWFAPDFLRSLVPSAVAFKLREGESVTRQLHAG